MRQALRCTILAATVVLAPLSIAFAQGGNPGGGALGPATPGGQSGGGGGPMVGQTGSQTGGQAPAPAVPPAPTAQGMDNAARGNSSGTQGTATGGTAVPSRP